MICSTEHAQFKLRVYACNKPSLITTLTSFCIFIKKQTFSDILAFLHIIILVIPYDVFEMNWRHDLTSIKIMKSASQPCVASKLVLSRFKAIIC